MGMPATQSFQIYDPDTFDLLVQGTTTAIASVATTPAEPIPTLSEWAIILLVLMMIGMVFFESRRQPKLEF